MACELDVGPKQRPVYGYDPDFWIATCKSCKVPMLWLKECTMEVDGAVMARMLSEAGRVGVQVYGVGKFYIDENQRKLKHHRHIHVRPREKVNEAVRRKIDVMNVGKRIELGVMPAPA